MSTTCVWEALLRAITQMSLFVAKSSTGPHTLLLSRDPSSCIPGRETVLLIHVAPPAFTCNDDIWVLLPAIEKNVIEFSCLKLGNANCTVDYKYELWGAAEPHTTLSCICLPVREIRAKAMNITRKFYKVGTWWKYIKLTSPEFFFSYGNFISSKRELEISKAREINFPLFIVIHFVYQVSVNFTRLFWNPHFRRERKISFGWV